MKRGATLSISIKKIIFFCMIVSCIALYDIKVLFLGTQFLAILALWIKRYCTIGKYAKKYITWGLAFGSFALLSRIWSSSVNHSLFSTVISFFQVLVIGFLVLDYYQDTKKTNEVILAYIFGCALLVVRFFIEIPYSSWGLQSRFPRSSIFGGNGPAISLSFAAVLLFGLLLKNRKNIKGYFRTIIIIFICLFVFVSLLMGTRKAVIILLSGLVLIILFEADTINKKIGSIILAVIVVTGTYLLVTKVPIIYNSVGYRLESVMTGLSEAGNGDASFNSRSLFAKDAWNVWKQNPIIGIGQDGYRYVNSVISGYYSHNNYVEILANLGLVGFVIYYSFFSVLMKDSLKIIKKDYLPFVLLIIVLLIDFFRISYSAENSFVIVSIIIILLSEYEDCEGKKI